jgi:hypothetical protein
MIEPNFTQWDVMIMELGARVCDYLFFQNTGTQYHRLLAINWQGLRWYEN